MRRHRRAGGFEGSPHRRHAAIRNKPVIPEAIFPEPVIEVAIEPKSKADRKSWAWRCRSWPRKIRLPRVDRSRSGQTIRRDGRTPPRHQSRHPEAHIQSRSHRRAPQVAYREKPRPGGDHRLHAQEANRRFGPVRAREDRICAGRTGHGLHVQERHRRRCGAEGIRAGRRKRA